MSKVVGVEENNQTRNVGMTRSVSSIQDIEQINAFKPDYLSKERVIDDPDIHDYGIEINGLILGKAQLYDRADLAVTTDFRQILSEIIIRRFSNRASSLNKIIFSSLKFIQLF